MINVPATGHTGTGNIVLDTSPTLITPNIGAASATSITFGQSVLSTYKTWANYTPTVTLVGGSGNTVPTYGNDNGRWLQIGNIVFVIVEKFNTSGNTAGAGTGQINIAIPVAAGTNVGTLPQIVGYFLNQTGSPNEGIVYGTLSSGTSTIALTYFNTISTTTNLTGALQNQTVRQIGMHFWYEV